MRESIDLIYQKYLQSIVNELLDFQNMHNVIDNLGIDTVESVFPICALGIFMQH